LRRDRRGRLIFPCAAGAPNRGFAEESMSKSVSFVRPDGRSVDGYLAEPAGAAGAPGIVVIQEWWGLNDQIRGVADKLAAAGYRALVPDLYRGKVALEANEADHLMKGLNFGDAAGQDVRGAVQYLKGSGSVKVGVTGFCMGGALTLLAACNVPEADAAVIWYGYPPLEFVDASRIKVPLMGHWATDDAAFAIGGVDTLEGKLRAAGVAYEFFRYDCKHAFANETADSKNLPILKYDAKAAELAWRRTMEFLARHLK
jgi:carboxymethylenebutenolidase